MARRGVALAGEPGRQIRGRPCARPTPVVDPARFLSALRDVLVRERPGSIELLPGFPPEWLGQSVTVDGVAAPGRSVVVRGAVARRPPALLWDAPPGVELRAPALDPGVVVERARAGETLLAEPPASLLPMGIAGTIGGEPVDAPGQFS